MRFSMKIFRLEIYFNWNIKKKLRNAQYKVIFPHSLSRKSYRKKCVLNSFICFCVVLSIWYWVIIMVLFLFVYKFELMSLYDKDDKRQKKTALRHDCNQNINNYLNEINSTIFIVCVCSIYRLNGCVSPTYQNDDDDQLCNRF